MAKLWIIKQYRTVYTITCEYSQITDHHMTKLWIIRQIRTVHTITCEHRQITDHQMVKLMDYQIQLFIQKPAGVENDPGPPLQSVCWLFLCVYI